MKFIGSFYQLTGFDFLEANFFTILGISGKFLSPFVFIFHVAYIFINLALQYNLQVEIFKHPDITGNITNLIEIVLPVLCHLTLVLESYFKRGKEAKMRKVMKRIQSNLNCNSRSSLPIVKFLF